MMLYGGIDIEDGCDLVGCYANAEKEQKLVNLLNTMLDTFRGNITVYICMSLLVDIYKLPQGISG